MTAKDDMQKLAKMSGKGLTKQKSRQRRKSAPAFKLQFARTEANKKRRLGKRVREHPNDAQAVRLYAERYGLESLKGHLAHAKGRKRRAEVEAPAVAPA